MTTYEVEVFPDQPWDEDGTAKAVPKAPYPSYNEVDLPLEHRERGPVTVSKSEYPDGLVIVATENALSGESAILPMKVSSGEEILIENHDHSDWPEGIVAMFTD